MKTVNKLLEEKAIGEYYIRKFQIGKNNIRALIDGIPEGEYVCLKKNGCVLMSDTPMELRTNEEFIKKSNGDVLIGGLGLGLIVINIQDKEDINSITIIEKSKEVIELITSQIKFNNKVKIIHGDIFKNKFPRGTKFDTLYFDIWPYINSDVFEEMLQVEKLYKRCLRSKKENPRAFMTCWCKKEAKHNKRI